MPDETETTEEQRFIRATPDELRKALEEQDVFVSAASRATREGDAFVALYLEIGDVFLRITEHQGHLLVAMNATVVEELRTPPAPPPPEDPPAVTGDLTWTGVGTAPRKEEGAEIAIGAPKQGFTQLLEEPDEESGDEDDHDEEAPST